MSVAPMFQNYQELAEEVADLLGRGDLSSKVPGWLALVESEMQKDIRDFRETILEETGNFVAGQDFIMAPSGFREALFIRIDTTPERRVSLVSYDKLIDVRVNGVNAGYAWPLVFAYGGERKILVEPAPVGDEQYTLLYHGYLADIDGSRSTSQVLRDTPEGLLYGAAVHGCNYIRDWELKREMKEEFRTHKRIYEKFLGRAKLGGGEVRVRPDNMPNDSYAKEVTGVP